MAVLTEERSDLRNLTHELDHGINSLGVNVSTLVDVEVLLGQLVDSMDEAVFRGEEKISYHEHFRKIRVYSELIRYAMDDLSADYEKVDKIKNQLFKLVVVPENKENQPTANELVFGFKQD